VDGHPLVEPIEEEEERDLINDLKRYGRLAVAWNRHGSPVPRWTLTRYGPDDPYSLSSAFHGVPPTPIEGEGPTMKRTHPQRGGGTRAERGDHNFPSTGRRRVGRPIVALPSATTPSWGGPSTRGPHGVCCPSDQCSSQEPYSTLLANVVEFPTQTSHGSHTILLQSAETRCHACAVLEEEHALASQRTRHSFTIGAAIFRFRYSTRASVPGSRSCHSQ